MGVDLMATARELLDIVAGPVDGWRLHPAVLAARVEAVLTWAHSTKEGKAAAEVLRLLNGESD
jgi:hypothetical protein